MTAHENIHKLIVTSEAPNCVLKVTGRLPRQSATWYAIWEAANAITAMCIREGKGGYWDGIGELNLLVQKLEGL